MNTTLHDLDGGGGGGGGDGLIERLAAANRQHDERFPGESTNRQPVHTVYGGAQLFRADSSARLGRVARRHFDHYFDTAEQLNEALGLAGEDHELAARIHRRVARKLDSEPVEDFRIDFEDGYGHRPDAEEDAEAVRTADEVVAGMAAGTLPPFLGIRIKPLTEELRSRSIRTLDLFVTRVIEAGDGTLPVNFVVTLPKVTIVEQVETLVALFEQLESGLGLSSGALRFELMVETTQSIFDADGRSALPALVAAGEGRCTGAHFGVYDYTASCDLIAADQHMRHPVCDFARHMMKVSLAGSGVLLSDGATNVMPVGPHRAAKEGPPLSAEQLEENRRIVYRVSRQCFDDVRHSLHHGIYQGWDLHPAQLPIRYAAVYGFFLQHLADLTSRLHSFVDRSAQASLHGEVFDDAATGQALLNFFLRGMSCGAVTEVEAEATGLALDEFRTRSFAAILKARRGHDV